MLGGEEKDCYEMLYVKSYMLYVKCYACSAVVARLKIM